MDENERRRQTAHEAWLLQLTPEQRGEYELAHMGEVMEASPEALEAAETLAEINEATEALQRAIERRH